MSTNYDNIDEMAQMLLQDPEKLADMLLEEADLEEQQQEQEQKEEAEPPQQEQAAEEEAAEEEEEEGAEEGEEKEEEEEEAEEGEDEEPEEDDDEEEEHQEDHESYEYEDLVVPPGAQEKLITLLGDIENSSSLHATLQRQVSDISEMADSHADTGEVNLLMEDLVNLGGPPKQPVFEIPSEGSSDELGDDIDDETTTFSPMMSRPFNPRQSIAGPPEGYWEAKMEFERLSKMLSPADVVHEETADEDPRSRKSTVTLSEFLESTCRVCAEKPTSPNHVCRECNAETCSECMRVVKVSFGMLLVCVKCLPLVKMMIQAQAPCPVCKKGKQQPACKCTHCRQRTCDSCVRSYTLSSLGETAPRLLCQTCVENTAKQMPINLKEKVRASTEPPKKVDRTRSKGSLIMQKQKSSISKKKSGTFAAQSKKKSGTFAEQAAFPGVKMHAPVLAFPGIKMHSDSAALPDSIAVRAKPRATAKDAFQQKAAGEIDRPSDAQEGVVLFDFNATKEGQINLVQGQPVFAWARAEEDNWATGDNGTEVGLFPLTYCSFDENITSIRKQPKVGPGFKAKYRSEEGDWKVGIVDDVSHDASSYTLILDDSGDRVTVSEAEVEPLTPRSLKSPDRSFQAGFCTEDSPGDAAKQQPAFSSGDGVKVFRQDKWGWCFGEVNGEEGFLPIKSIKLTTKDESPSSVRKQSATDSATRMKIGGSRTRTRAAAVVAEIGEVVPLIDPAEEDEEEEEDEEAGEEDDAQEQEAEEAPPPVPATKPPLSAPAGLGSPPTRRMPPKMVFTDPKTLDMSKSTPEKRKVIKPFEGVAASFQLSVKNGEIVEQLLVINSTWALCQNAAELRGYVPTRVLTDDLAAVPSAPKPTPASSPFGRPTKSVIKARVPQQKRPQNPMRVPPKPSADRVLAVIPQSFIKAASANQTVLLARYLDEGLHVDCRDPDSGDTGLIAACKTGYVDTVRFLVSKGANVNLCNRAGNTALHVLAQNGNLKLALWLLRRGANANAKNERNQTPLTLSRGLSELVMSGAMLEDVEEAELVEEQSAQRTRGSSLNEVDRRLPAAEARRSRANTAQALGTGSLAAVYSTSKRF